MKLDNGPIFGDYETQRILQRILLHLRPGPKDREGGIRRCFQCEFYDDRTDQRPEMEEWVEMRRSTLSTLKKSYTSRKQQHLQTRKEYIQRRNITTNTRSKVT